MIIMFVRSSSCVRNCISRSSFVHGAMADSLPHFGSPPPWPPEATPERMLGLHRFHGISSWNRLIHIHYTPSFSHLHGFICQSAGTHKPKLELVHPLPTPPVCLRIRFEPRRRWSRRSKNADADAQNDDDASRSRSRSFGQPKTDRPFPSVDLGGFDDIDSFLRLKKNAKQQNHG